MLDISGFSERTLVIRILHLTGYKIFMILFLEWKVHVLQDVSRQVRIYIMEYCS